MHTDAQLIRALADSDKKAFEELYDRYHLLLWKIAAKDESDHHVCEQLVTEVFKQVWLKPNEFVSEKRLVLLLIECCRSKMKERPRRKPLCPNLIEPQICCG